MDDEITAYARAYVERIRRAQRADAEAAQDARARLAAAVRDLAPRLGVTRAVAFGSLVWGGFDAGRSDVDLVVWGVDVAAGAQLTAALWDLVRRPVHVLRAEDAPATLLARIAGEGVPLDVA
jgi:predicted nucleotidyltransferase